MCLNKIKNLMITNFFYLYDRFLESNQNFTTEHVKIDKIQVFPGFFSDICSKFQVFPGYFCINCQIPGFSRFPGKEATLFFR